MKILLAAILVVSFHHCIDAVTDCGDKSCMQGGIVQKSPVCACDGCCKDDESKDCEIAKTGDPPSIGEDIECQVAPEAVSNSGRKRREANDVVEREKRQSGKKVNHWWRCDFPCAACCRTCRRTIPLVGRIKIKGSFVYPVWCPQSGGHQLVDQIACVPFGCKNRCKKEVTLYSVMVSSVEHHPTTGHCSNIFLPVYFVTVKKHTHCVCPKEGKKCGKGRG